MAPNASAATGSVLTTIVRVAFKSAVDAYSGSLQYLLKHTLVLKSAAAGLAATLGVLALLLRRRRPGPRPKRPLPPLSPRPRPTPSAPMSPCR